VSYQQHRHSQKTKQRAKEGKHAEKRKNCRPARISSPGRRHQHLHEAAAERQEHCLQGERKKTGEEDSTPKQRKEEGGPTSATTAGCRDANATSTVNYSASIPGNPIPFVLISALETGARFCYLQKRA
jgi:hypothetical protein